MAWQTILDTRIRILILIWVALFALPSPLAADPKTEKHLDLILLDQKGKKVKLADITANKPSLLYFWATWCKPCRKVTPKVAKLSKKYHGRIQVVGISVGGMDSIQNIEKYRTRYQIEYPLFLDHDNQALKVFTIMAIPAFVLLDPSGKILYSGTPLVDDPTSEGFQLFRRVLYTTGVVSIIIGALSGSYLGNIYDVPMGLAAEGLPALIDSIKEWMASPIKFLIFALIVGLIHLNIAFFISLYKGIKEGDRAEVLAKVGIILFEFLIPVVKGFADNRLYC